MIRLATLLDVSSTSGPVMVMRYNMYSSTAITGNAAPGTSSGEAIALMEEIAREELPRSMAPDWTELAYMQLNAGSSATIAFRAGGGLRVPGAGGPVRELEAAAGGDPGDADVPALLSGGCVPGRHGCEPLHADRVRGAGGPGQQERDLDRRIRQAEPGVGHSASGSDRSPRAGCGYDRS